MDSYHLPGVCALPGCDRPAHAASYCHAHATRIRRHGDPGSPVIGVYGQGRNPCTGDGCDRPAFTRGMCAKHYMRTRRKVS
jgi:hypothetical protein